MRVRKGLPKRAVAKPSRGGVGFRPVSTDGLPVLGRVTRLPNLVVATGLGANGLTFGPSAGAMAAELILGRDPDVDLSAFRPDR